MAIPDYQTVMLPLLKIAEDKQEHSIRETIDHIANIFGLNEQERKKLLPSGTCWVGKNIFEESRFN